MTFIFGLIIVGVNMCFCLFYCSEEQKKMLVINYVYELYVTAEPGLQFSFKYTYTYNKNINNCCNKNLTCVKCHVAKICLKKVFNFNSLVHYIMNNTAECKIIKVTSECNTK